MKLDTSTDQVVSDLVASLLPPDSSVREKHIVREALRGLVRLAKSEQMVEMKNNVRRLTGSLTDSVARARARSMGSTCDGYGQQHFEF